ncbi:phosphoenolpyruvate--protein phosphotransferase [candidate division WOR-3 bacterium JGI_Cruoil_03_44_89]|uniref:Phosphoenolpyruvate-protein phosphotransferase n=1 Tax=candidate division WOR-3 bacterium JGI_Cruoil_03_44_89 TaxID=1973748 RepID=A0A235BN06_UNCW3|nr:MAG: phosphoenolpyruvate--protein phosphotransferase [candidate division WOR-3 bacterium JGI_Cruoil_03_44_89]
MRRRNKILRGIPASPGISLKKAILLEGEDGFIMGYDVSDIEKEVQKFDEAVERTREEIITIKNRLEEVTDPYSAKIFDAQLLFLENGDIIHKTKNNIRRSKRNAEFVFDRTVREMASSLDRERSVFFRDKWGEMADVVSRVIRNIKGKTSVMYDGIAEECNIVAHGITASNMALLPRESVKGVVTEMGGRTSHTTIVARAFDIPAVVGVQDLLKYTKSGDLIIVDGTRGIVVINPDESTLKTYEERDRRYRDYTNGLVNLSDIPPTTVDGHTIELSANIELPMEIESALNHGARGIGLFRTEFLFMNGAPTEEEQLEVYKYCAESIGPDSIIIRTVDIGGDKLLQDASFCDANPFLGWRAIRVYLKEKKILKTQLRAILRASAFGNVKIMFPLVSAIEEIKLLKDILRKTQRELKKDGVRYDENIEVGIMVEVPSAAILAEDFAKEVGFFSIGSNDLTQYTLACDRGNPRVANIFKPLHPAVLRLIKNTVDAGHSQDIWVGLCGELGSETIAVPVLLGLGLDELSVCPTSVPEIKSVIRHLTMGECHEIALKALSMSSAVDVEGYLASILKEKSVGMEDVPLHI